MVSPTLDTKVPLLFSMMVKNDNNFLEREFLNRFRKFETGSEVPRKFGSSGKLWKFRENWSNLRKIGNCEKNEKI
jgi:hypothetical protein